MPFVFALCIGLLMCKHLPEPNLHRELLATQSLLIRNQCYAAEMQIDHGDKTTRYEQFGQQLQSDHAYYETNDYKVKTLKDKVLYQCTKGDFNFESVYFFYDMDLKTLDAAAAEQVMQSSKGKNSVEIRVYMQYNGLIPVSEFVSDKAETAPKDVF